MSSHILSQASPHPVMPRLILLLVVAVLGFGCEDTASVEPRPTESEYDRFVDDVSAQLPELLEAEAAGRATPMRADAWLDASPGHPMAPGLAHPLVLRQLYAERDQRPAWVAPDTDDGLTPAGARLLEELDEAVAVDGLWPESVRLDQLDELRQRYTSEQADLLTDATLTDGEQASLAHWLKANDVDVSEADPSVLLHRWSRRTGPTPRLGELLEARAHQIDDVREQAMALELAMSDALVHYARQMRFDHHGWYDDDQVIIPEPEDPNALGRTGRPEDTTPKPEARIDALLTALRPIFASPDKVGPAMDRLRPHYEQYARLREAHQTYASLVEAGGWEPIPAQAEELLERIEPAEGDGEEEGEGADQDDESTPSQEDLALLSALRERLNTEGYSVDDAASASAVAPVRAALKRYQLAHRIEPTGELDEQTLASLNVPAARRLAELRLNLQRWRESPIGADPYYVYVNVPDAAAEVWQDGERRMRFRVVVGAGRDVWDAALGKKVWQGETPRFSDEMETIEFNPYWWIPRSIWVNELAPKQRQDPGYYARKGYEYGTTQGGVTKLRQKPGPNNALGQVKFLFPNDHAVYLHDTPHDSLFSETVRNFSHGCMRVEKPKDFAKFLLMADGRGTEAQVAEEMKAMFARDEPTPVQLNEPVPVHIDYITARVDDEGTTEFLQDIYELDPELLEARAERRAEREARIAAEHTQEEAVEEL